MISYQSKICAKGLITEIKRVELEDVALASGALVDLVEGGEAAGTPSNFFFIFG